MLYALDAWFVDKVERFFQMLQRATGLDKFFFSDLCSVTIISSLLVGIKSTRTPMVDVGVIIIFSMRILFYTPYERRQTEARMQKGLANPNKIKNKVIYMRYFSIWLMLIITACIMLLSTPKNFFISNLYVYPWCLLVYLESIDPLPPCQSKIKAWFKKMFTTLQPT